jgi:hypothetical protein
MMCALRASFACVWITGGWRQLPVWCGDSPHGVDDGVLAYPVGAAMHARTSVDELV